MSQAEIAGGRVPSSGELPRKGLRFPDFELMADSGRTMRTSDYRGRSNLVLLFLDDRAETAELLAEMARVYDKCRSAEAEVIAVAQCAQPQCARMRGQRKLPFPVLSDADGRIHREVGAMDDQGHAAAALYVTDRYGEIFGVFRTREGQLLPTAAEVLNWLEFVNSQCPECEPPEWPA